MKSFLLLLLALLFISQTAFAQSDWTTLSSEEVDSEDAPLGTLNYFGWKYVLEKGIFQSTKFPLTNGEWGHLSTEKTEKRTTNQVTYYRFTVQIGLNYGASGTYRARYVISYRPSNGRILISSWSYSLAEGPETEENGSSGVDFIDIRSINEGKGDVALLLDDAIPWTVNDAIKKGLLPNSDYNLGYVYSCETSGEVPPIYTFLFSLVSSEKNYYLLEIGVADYSVLGENAEEVTQLDPTYEVNPAYESPVQYA